MEGVVALPDAIGGDFDGGYVHAHRLPGLCESFFFIFIF